MSLSLTGSTIDRLHEAVRFSEVNRRGLVIAKTQLRIRTAHQLQAQRRAARQSPPTDTDIDAAVDITAVTNQRVKVAIEREQWGARLGTLYGVLALVEGQRQLAAEQRRTNELLARLCKIMGTYEAVEYPASGT